MSRSADGRAALGRLARAYGVQVSYTDDQGRRRSAHSEALLGALRARGAPVESVADVPGALKERAAEQDARAIPPVIVAWDGRFPQTQVRLSRAARAVRCTLETEEGERRAWDVPARGRTAAVRIRDRLPPGRHRLRVEAGSELHEAWVLAAPLQAYTLDEAQWGVFAPVYALARSGACHGTYSELHRLCRSMHERGATLVATLPILAAFLDAPFDASPYAPASRLFWNELYVDPVPLGASVTDAQERQLAECVRTGLVDYAAAATVHRELLQPLADRALGTDGDPAARAFAARPDVASYAHFRAVGERQGGGWRAWPDRLRNGRIRDGDFDPGAARYHAFVQWAAEGQVAQIARDPAAAALYLDMPLGVHPDSYDTWRYREVFAASASAGAPPDVLFRGGQNWGFPPMDPDALRADGYRYLAAALRQQLRYARVLRLDHVMALRRLYWIPDGLPATEGVYVRYAEDEMFAVLTLESLRAHAAIVGEDLGTVPPAVRRRLEKHAIHRMYVVQYEADAKRRPPLRPPPARSAASLNTHDMPTFTGFWHGDDIRDMRALSLLDEAGERAAHEQRARLRAALARHVHRPNTAAAADDPAPTLDGLLDWLASSRAVIALAGLEDLWLEPQPQNVPGTGPETRPNWQRRFRYPFPDVLRRTEVSTRLQRIGATRARRPQQSKEQE